ncbi:MAG: hypothetical protein RIR00_409 [Pseudomonadota bacterium]|jgi:phospholipid/cholesterol/gamma-HCH transport system substrate-binding protein
MENRAHAFAAGLFAILLGLATLVALLWLGAKREDQHTYVVVTRQNVTGLNAQAQVRYRGIQVGKVGEIRIDPHDVRNILITIQVAQDVPITLGTSAKLGYQGVTGLAHILLEDDGDDLRPAPVGEPPHRIIMELSLIEELGDSSTEVLRSLRQLLDNGNALLNAENRRNLGRTLANVETATASLPQLTRQLEASLTQVRRLLAEDNLRKVGRTLDEAEPVLRETRTLLRSLQKVSDKLEQGVGDTGGHGAAALPPRLLELGEELSNSSRQLNRLLHAIEQSPQSLVFGKPGAAPGPGEPGFTPPAAQ